MSSVIGWRSVESFDRGGPSKDFHLYEDDIPLTYYYTWKIRKKHQITENNGYVVFKYPADQLGNIGCLWEGKVLLHPPPPFLHIQVASGQMFKDDVNGFSSTLDIWFVFFIIAEFAKLNIDMISHFPEQIIKNFDFKRLSHKKAIIFLNSF